MTSENLKTTSNIIEVNDTVKIVYSPAHIALQDIQDLIIDGWRIGKQNNDIAVMGFNILRITLYKDVEEGVKVSEKSTPKEVVLNSEVPELPEEQKTPVEKQPVRGQRKKTTNKTES